MAETIGNDVVARIRVTAPYYHAFFDAHFTLHIVTLSTSAFGASVIFEIRTRCSVVHDPLALSQECRYTSFTSRER